MKLAIGGDHAGFAYKQEIIAHLHAKGYTVKDFGPFTPESVDYPDYVHPLADAVERGEFAFGILLCGSANGVAMTANKHRGIRAAVVWDVPLAQLARAHNDANIICLPARFIPMDLAIRCTEEFLKTSFEGGRHQRRVEKICC
ncbi:MAG: ribose 5-phosphate isomerase B [Chitinophagales bacterium]|nr:ribose 5-phosphate isomerase B [Chitinophagales bacterium]MDW8418227.1 ribose 5-phosphate isomerase B [Chitinophagales bacterium]